jgi:hypothetical protein
MGRVVHGESDLEDAARGEEQGGEPDAGWRGSGLRHAGAAALGGRGNYT